MLVPWTLIPGVSPRYTYLHFNAHHLSNYTHIFKINNKRKKLISLFKIVAQGSILRQLLSNVLSMMHICSWAYFPCLVLLSKLWICFMLHPIVPIMLNGFFGWVVYQVIRRQQDAGYTDKFQLMGISSSDIRALRLTLNGTTSLPYKTFSTY